MHLGSGHVEVGRQIQEPFSPSAMCDWPTEQTRSSGLVVRPKLSTHEPSSFEAEGGEITHHTGSRVLPNSPSGHHLVHKLEGGNEI